MVRRVTGLRSGLGLVLPTLETLNRQVWEIGGSNGYEKEDGGRAKEGTTNGSRGCFRELAVRVQADHPELGFQPYMPL